MFQSGMRYKVSGKLAIFSPLKGHLWHHVSNYDKIFLTIPLLIPYMVIDKKSVDIPTLAITVLTYLSAQYCLPQPWSVQTCQ